jgi:hypothetical protein
VRRMLATPPQPVGVVKVGYQAVDGPDRGVREGDIEKAPRDGGARVNGVEQTKGTDWLKARRAAA